MTQLPLNSLLIFTQALCFSVVWVRPIDLALNNRILTGWGWTAIVNNVLSSTTLLSSEKHFGSPHLSPLMSDWRRWTIKTQNNHKRRIRCTGQLSRLAASIRTQQQFWCINQCCRGAKVAKHWWKASRIARSLCLDLAWFKNCSLKPVLNWANVCSPEHTSDTSTNYDSFLNWTFSSQNMVRTVQTLLHSQLACNEMQASARTCGRRAADSMIENVG